MTVSAKGADYTIAAATDNCTLFLMQGGQKAAKPAVVTLPPAKTAGKNFTVAIQRDLDGPPPIVLPNQLSYVQVAVDSSSSDDIGRGGTGNPYFLYLPGSSVTLTSDGNGEWVIANATGSTGKQAPALCDTTTVGTPPNLLTDCYQGSGGGPIALAAGSPAITGTSKLLQSVPVNSGQSIWVEMGGTRVLSLNSTDSWQSALSAGGNSYDPVKQFSQPNLIAGWVCPPSIYTGDVSGANTIGKGCLFYDLGQSQYSLNFFNSSAGNNIGQPWGSSTADEAWFKGNHKVCVDEGMRLPTLFETQAESPLNGLPTNFTFFPSFGFTSGIPSSAATWTATTFFDPSFATDFSKYQIWSGSLSGFGDFFDVFMVRCVLQ